MIELARQLELASKDLAALMSREVGKPFREAVGELKKCAWTARHFAEVGPGVALLSELELEALSVAGTDVDDATVARFPSSVRSLGLMKTRVTSGVVKALVALPRLREVDLRALGLSDADVAPLVAREVDVKR